jgi:hypothetical protein
MSSTGEEFHTTTFKKFSAKRPVWNLKALARAILSADDGRFKKLFQENYVDMNVSLYTVGYFFAEA